MSNTTDFATSKSLSQYVKIPCKRYHRESKETGEVFEAEFSDAMLELGSEVYNFYPSPTLEELLGVCPITGNINVLTVHGEILIAWSWEDEHEKIKSIPKSDNLAQAVGNIILEYYRSKE